MSVGDPLALFRERLEARVRDAGLSLTPDNLERFERYYRLLGQWNAKINLTALALQHYPVATLDRLFVEPLVAAELVEDAPLNWFDLGSGGGSPAIPLKIVRSRASLTMVESMARKVAFLREAVRVVGLEDVNVLAARIEDLPTKFRVTPADLITIRAVRIDESIALSMFHLLKRGGLVLHFGSDLGPVLAGFRSRTSRRLSAAGNTLVVWEKL